MSILINFEFLDHELVNHTVNYLTETEKEFLSNKEEARQRGFNGTGFTNKTKLTDYMEERAFIYKKELIAKLDSKSRRTNEQTIEKLYKIFIKETPLFIVTERLYRMMLLSSSLMFSPNEKICFTVLFDNPYIPWSAEEIKRVAEHNNLLTLHVDKIEESLDRHVSTNSKTKALVSCEINGEKKYYRINFTHFIFYIRKFYNEVNIDI